MAIKKLVGLVVLLGATGSAVAQEYFPPTSGQAPAVILLSGQTGTERYRDKATDVATLGYTAVLVDGKEVSPWDSSGARNLQRLITRVQSDPRVKAGKVVVVGYSLGGGGALVHATGSTDLVAAVAAFYPAISKLPSIPNVARQGRVPTILFAGGKDYFNSCCLIESMQQYADAAKKGGGNAELVAYPDATHGFNLRASPTYRPEDDEHSWQRLKHFLASHSPLK